MIQVSPVLSTLSQSIASEYGIAAMPTFMMIKDGAKVDEVVGAAKERLKAMIEKYRTVAAS